MARRQSFGWWSWLDSFYPILGNLKILLVHLDADEVAPSVDARNAGCATAHEWVKNYAA